MSIKSPLWGDADFLRDCASDLTKKQIMEKWGVSSGLVVDVRKTHGRASTGDRTEVHDGPDGKRFEFIRNRPITLEDARALVRSSGDDPDLFHYSIRSIAYGGDKSSNKVSVWPKQGMDLAQAAPLAQMYKEAAKPPRPQRATDSAPSRGTVVVLADWQVGKVGSRGGTPELLKRLDDAREQVKVELFRRNPAEILILDGGDGIENFESGGSPLFTNDLSLPDQLDCYATELLKFIRLAQQFAPVQAGVVPSNHAAWRRGKQTLGKPSDDFGLFIHRQVAKTAEAAGTPVTLHLPAEYDESLCVDFMGVPIGLVHGNQFAPGKAVDWWQAQAFGGQAVTRADVLVSAHYHSFGAGVAGMNPATKRERMWLGAPTLDSGSDWYRNAKGRDSLPGTLIFDVTPEGFDLGSLKIL